MGNGIRVKKRRFFYNLNYKKPTSGKKIENSLKWYELVLSKKEKLGYEKWVEKTLKKVFERFRKYGITKHMLREYLEKRNKLHLYIEF